MEGRVAWEPRPAPAALAGRNRVITLTWSRWNGGHESGFPTTGIAGSFLQTGSGSRHRRPDPAALSNVHRSHITSNLIPVLG